MEETAHLIRKIEVTMRKHALIRHGDSVIVGFSGGPDSTALLHMLCSISGEYGLKLSAVYVNHNLRPDEIASEIGFCSRFCNERDIPFKVKSIDVAAYSREHRMNIHEAARKLRYDAFREAAFEAGAGKIAVAHNADDQAETFILRLARGSGPAGMAGIPISRDNIVRPLLEIVRNEIDRYLDLNKIKPVTDSSNLKQDYSRNRIRLSVMPELRRINPNIVHTLSGTMDILREEERYFEILVTKTLMKLISRKSTDRIELFLLPMETMEKVILRRVLRRAINETKGLAGIGFGHIEDVISLIKEGGAGMRLFLPKGIRVIREYSLLVLTSETPSKLSDFSLDLGAEVALQGAGLVISASVQDSPMAGSDGLRSVVLDAEKLQFPLLVRSRRPGDTFHPAGLHGRRKKLQDFFVDLKIPRDERDNIPIVISDDNIVWIAGYRCDDRFSVTEATKKFVRLAIVKGKF